MNYNEFLNRVIDDGIAAAKADYKNDKNKLEGSIAGFEACRNKMPTELLEVWKETNAYVTNAFAEHDDAEKYWWFRCYQLEVEWVCNVVSALMINEGQPPILSWFPTCGGFRKAASIVGIRPENKII